MAKPDCPPPRRLESTSDAVPANGHHRFVEQPLMADRRFNAVLFDPSDTHMPGKPEKTGEGRPVPAATLQDLVTTSRSCWGRRTVTPTTIISGFKSKMISRRQGRRRRKHTNSTLRSLQRTSEASVLIWNWNKYRFTGVGRQAERRKLFRIEENDGKSMPPKDRWANWCRFMS